MKNLNFLILILLFLGITTTANAQTWIQIGDDIDGEAAGDYSGTSVSISADGSVVAIGAQKNDGNGNRAGHVRVFQNISGTWVQIGQDIDGEDTDDYSGQSVCLSTDGSVVAIGAGFNNGNGYDAGHVRIYQNIDETWVQTGQDIDGEFAGDRSGWSVSLSADGSVAAIGAYLNNGSGSVSGHVRVYKNISETWVQIGQDINGEAAGDYSGRSVSLSDDGSIVAIGAYGNGGNGSWAGHVRAYQYFQENWIQIGQDIDGKAIEDYSGQSVSISADGTIMAIGAYGNDGNGNSSGHVIIYQNISGTWVQIGQDINGEAEGDCSGWSVSLSDEGSVVAIGAPWNNGAGFDSGHVRVYQNISGNWIQIGQDIDGEAANNYSGRAVSISADGSIVAIGADLNNGNGSSAGHVRIYALNTAIVDTQFLNGISIYPTPTNGLLNINLSEVENIKKVKLKITDITGKILIEKTNIQQHEEIDLSPFGNGIYIINIQMDNELFTAKIVKK